MEKNKYKILILVLFSTLIILSAGLVSAAQLPIDLGTAGDFVILSEAQITDATPASSIITGNVGVHPAAGTYIQDVSCSTVTGTIYDNNAGYTGGFDSDVTCLVTDGTLLGNAVQDMDDARLDAQGRIPNDVTKDTNEQDTGILSPTTPSFLPGLHTWSTAVTITTSITLDCASDPNGIFIFQIAQTLDLANAAEVFITNCQASNIFWVVAGQTTLGTYSTFNGNILDVTGVAIQTGATLNGRALAQTAVTLDDNSISLPITTDTTPPVITILGTNPINIAQNTIYIDAGATALDDVDGVIIVSSSGAVDTSIIATYTITYDATDAAGNTATDTRTVNVLVDTPVLTTITLLPISANLTVESTLQLNATSLDQFDNPIIAVIDYTTDNSSVATVDATGFVTAIAPGIVIITASNGGISVTSVITVVAALVETSPSTGGSSGGGGHNYVNTCEIIFSPTGKTEIKDDIKIVYVENSCTGEITSYEDKIKLNSPITFTQPENNPEPTTIGVGDQSNQLTGFSVVDTIKQNPITTGVILIIVLGLLGYGIYYFRK